jgi:two-component system cell cycle sensor histidine kinase/response regulator CckA
VAKAQISNWIPHATRHCVAHHLLKSLGMGDYSFIEGIPHKEPDSPQAKPSAASESAGGGQEVILVIDDDSDILNIVRRLLIHEGWVVLTASDPLEGLQLYEAHWEAIQLVLLDYFLPTLRGDDVFERLRQINPHVRVLLTTACLGDVSPKMVQGGLYGFVQKPLSPRELIGWIRRSLNHDDPPSPSHLAETAQID